MFRSNPGPVEIDSASAVSEYCHVVRLNSGAGLERDWEKLIDQLVEKAKAYPDPDLTQRGSDTPFPFMDIIIKDPQAADGQLVPKLQEAFRREFTDVPAFRCLSIYDRSLDACYCYFGHGVFSHIEPFDKQTDELQISFNDPASDEFNPAAHIVEPRFTQGPNMAPVAFSAGQRGFAFAFSADRNLSSPYAPACVALPTWLKADIVDDMDDAVVFVGRKSRFGAAAAELFRPLKTEGKRPVVTFERRFLNFEGHEDPLRLSGLEWQEISLLTRRETLTIWMRLLPRTGAANFSSKPPVEATKGYFKVKGFLLPRTGKIPFWSGLRGVSRLDINFTETGQFRTRELQSARFFVAINNEVTASAAYSATEGLAWHAPSVDDERRMVFSQIKSRDLIVENFPPKHLQLSTDKNKNRQAVGALQAVKRTYGGGNWWLASLRGFNDLACVELTDGFLTGKPAPPVMFNEDSNRLLSLDWLNRIAQIKHKNLQKGAGEYWDELYDVEVSRDVPLPEKYGESAILIETTRKRNTARRTVSVFQPGHFGMIGPLFVQYIGPSPLKPEEKNETIKPEEPVAAEETDRSEKDGFEQKRQRLARERDDV